MKWLQSWALNFVIKHHKTWLLTGGKKGVQADFSKQDLRKAKFNSADLREASFWRSNMAKADVSFADVREGNFSNSLFLQGRFTEADMSGATFTKTRMWYVDISTAEIRKAKHEIHIKNRQKEDYEEMRSAAMLLWWDVMRLEKSEEETSRIVAKAIGAWLNNWNIERPINKEI